jgi:hypothetical protein
VSQPAPSCGTDLECATGDKCTNLGCVPTCTDSSTCTGGVTCNGGYCIPPTVSITPVDPNTNPNPNPNPTPVPTSCTTDAECQKADPTLVCDLNTSRCIDACTNDSDCPPNYVCAPCGQCTPAATPSCGEATIYCDTTQATSCGANRACLAGNCHVTCDGNSPCPIGQVCQSGVCVDDPNPSSPQCALSSQCAGSAVCINGFCHPKCTSDAGCGPAEVCSTGGGSEGVCMPDYRPAT